MKILRFACVALLIVASGASVAQNAEVLPCRCEPGDVRTAPDGRGYIYSPQWVIKDPVTKKPTGVMWEVNAASIAMYGPELIGLARKIAALPANPATDALKTEAQGLITRIEAARK